MTLATAAARRAELVAEARAAAEAAEAELDRTRDDRAALMHIATRRWMNAYADQLERERGLGVLDLRRRERVLQIARDAWESDDRATIDALDRAGVNRPVLATRNLEVDVTRRIVPVRATRTVKGPRRATVRHLPGVQA